MRLILATFAAVLVGGSGPDPSLPPAWMLGHWQMCGQSNTVTETWTAGGDTIVGMGVTVRPGRPTTYEYLRIGPGSNGSLSFYASPQGAPVTEFRLVESGPQRLVFANPQHDFPQRVIYAREGDQLTGAIEGGDGEQARRITWTYHRAALGDACPAQG